MFIHQGNLDLSVRGTARIGKTKIAFCPDSLPVEVSELQCVNQRRSMLNLATGARNAGRFPGDALRRPADAAA